METERKSTIILIIILFIIFLLFKYFGDRKDKIENENKKNMFFHDSIKWRVESLYIDSYSHMSEIMEIRSLINDSVFEFMPSNLRFPASFYKIVQKGDTIIKDTNSLKILIKAGLRYRIVECDTWFWTEKPIPFSPQNKFNWETK